MTKKEYPMIVECSDCGFRHIPVPLDEYPVDMFEITERMLKEKSCMECGSTEQMITQAEDAYIWYDENVRND